MEATARLGSPPGFPRRVTTLRRTQSSFGGQGGHVCRQACSAPTCAHVLTYACVHTSANVSDVSRPANVSRSSTTSPTTALSYLIWVFISKKNVPTCASVQLCGCMQTCRSLACAADACHRAHEAPILGLLGPILVAILENIHQKCAKDTQKMC